MDKSKLTTIVVLIVIVILGVFFGYRVFWQSSPVDNQAGSEALQAEADEINPFNQEKPANPFEETTNPYENIKTNPFE
ncbi:MAG: hypothetical protein HYT69_02245 [Candidatus Zambryskibacteria bacterium]|nr:hypothetical protein [Candidatus Zambryskibacteria bacterium]